MGKDSSRSTGDAGVRGISDPNFAARLREMGPFGIGAILLILLTGNLVFSNMVVVPMGAMLTLAWVNLSQTPWRDIGYAKQRNWAATVIGGLITGILLKLIVKSFFMPLLGADPINTTYHFLQRNESLLPMAILAMVVAGFAEETVYRGFLFERLGKLFGSSIPARISIVLLTSAVFALGHLSDQRLAGMEQAIFTGLTFGTIYTVTGRLFFVMAAHTAYDLAALCMIYTGTEVDFAHFIFK